MRRAIDDYGEDTWWENTRPDPLTFRATDETAEPNQSVTLETN